MDYTTKLPYTNVHNLPKEIVSAITKDRYTDSNDLPSDFSASKLVNPIQITILTQRHKDNLVVEDVIDLFYRFRGSVAHAVLEDSWVETMGSRIEERLYMTVEGKTISGKFDCYQSGELRDYKFTKSYKVVKNDFQEWEIQLNIYAELLRQAGHPVSKLVIWAFIDDWKQSEAYKRGYPQQPIVPIELRLWPVYEIRSWIKTRVIALTNAEQMDDIELANMFPCSDRDCWSDVKDYAIMKNGSDRATKCFDTQEEAVKVFEEKYELATHSVVKRLTPTTRCDKYCACREICIQRKERKSNGVCNEQELIF